MKILVAVDDSPDSERAVRFVTRMRWPAGSRMIVANVVPVSERSVTPKPHRPRVSPTTRAQDQLRDSGLPTELRVAEGDPREGLVELVQSERVDLLVMGSRGHSGLARWILGSVSSHAVGHAGCSVLVVKASQEGDRS